MSSRSRSPFLTFIILLFAGCLCLGVFTGLMLVSLPNRAAELFGPPAPSIGTRQLLQYAIQLALQPEALSTPANPSGTPQTFVIGFGEPTGQVIQRLTAVGLLTDPELFRIYLQYKGLDTSIQAGEYQLSPAMSPIELARALQDATPAQVVFNILPGWRLEEIAAALPTSGLEIHPDLFLAETRAPHGRYQLPFAIPDQASLEGILFPDEYLFERQIGVNAFIQALLDRQNAYLTSDLLNGFGEQGLTTYEAYTLASIVQRESVDFNEMPLIASVFYNRMAIGMKLESDPTVQYALGYNREQKTWWTNPLSAENLQYNSPYNSYVYSGFPPGPIAMPGLNALRAVAAPAQTPYYYFRAACDHSGRHVFAETFAEHVANACP